MATKTKKSTTKSNKLKTLGYESLMRTEKEMTIVQTDSTTLETLLPEESQLFVRLTDGQVILYSGGEIRKFASVDACNEDLGIDLNNHTITNESLDNNGAEIRRVIT